MKYVLGGIAICLFVLACSEDSTTPGDVTDTELTVEDYFPVGLFSTWIYSFYDSAGAPMRDAQGLPASGEFQISGIALDRNDTLFYNMEFPSMDYPVAPSQNINFVDSIFPNPGVVAGEDDPIIIYFSSAEVTEVVSVSFIVDPPVLLSTPEYSSDSLTLTFTHSEDFETYTDYSMTVEFEVRVPPLSRTVEDRFSFTFRTTAPVFRFSSGEYRVCSTKERVYKFWKSGTDFDLSNPDSCYIPIDAPLTVGHRWYDSRYGYEVLSIGNLSLEGGDIDDVLEIGQYWGSIGSDSGHVRWYAPNIGLVKMVDGDVVMTLDEYVP